MSAPRVPRLRPRSALPTVVPTTSWQTSLRSAALRLCLACAGGWLIGSVLSRLVL